MDCQDSPATLTLLPEFEAFHECQSTGTMTGNIQMAPGAVLVTGLSAFQNKALARGDRGASRHLWQHSPALRLEPSFPCPVAP